MPGKIRDYAAAGLLSLLGACASNPDAVEGANRILDTAPRSFVPQKAPLPEELEIYKKGPVIIESTDGYLLAHPIYNRDAARLVDPIKQLFPDCTLSIDAGTNRLIMRVPYASPTPTTPQPVRDTRLNEVKKFIANLDVKVPQYDIQAYVMQVAASELHRVRSSLDILAESGDVKFALNSTQLNNGQEDRGIQHTITGILDSFLPTFQISALFNGLEHYGIVRNLSFATATADEGESATINNTRKIPVPKIFPGVPIPIIGYEYTDVVNSLQVVPRARANNLTEVDLKLTRGNLLPSGMNLMNFQPQIPLHDISSRKTEAKLQVPIGRPLILATTLDDNSMDIDEGSPLGKIVGSNSLKERKRVYEVAVVIVNRVDPNSQAEGFPVEEFKRQLESKKPNSN
ncbi:MAG: hypothetical protein AABY16_01985 [Nanoarchaeota archaeon]